MRNMLSSLMLHVFEMNTMPTLRTAVNISPTTNNAAIMNIFSAVVVFLSIGKVMMNLFYFLQI